MFINLLKLGHYRWDRDTQLDDIQNNDTQHYDTQHNKKNRDTQRYGTVLLNVIYDECRYTKSRSAL